MAIYRKYLEPSYGPVAPEVEIMAPQVMDMEHKKPGGGRVIMSRWRL